MKDLDLEKHLLPTDKEIEEVSKIFEKGERLLDRIIASGKFDKATLGLDYLER